MYNHDFQQSGNATYDPISGKVLTYTAIFSSGLHDRTFVQLSIRPQFDKIYFNGQLSAVHLRPSNTNDRGPSSETVHEMDARRLKVGLRLRVGMRLRVGA